MQVQIGSANAEVLDAQSDRVVVRIPTLAAVGSADVTVTTQWGFLTATAALQYEGPGQPQGFATNDLPATFPLGGVAPAASALTSTDPEFPDVVAAFGAADSALLVLADAGAAYATVPLGIVPTSVAARTASTASPKASTLEVLAVDAEGVLAWAQATVDPTSGWAITATNAVQSTGTPSFSPLACTVPRALFPTGAAGSGPAVVAWRDATGTHVAAYDVGPSMSPTLVTTSVVTLPSPLLSWAARPAATPPANGHVLLVTASDVYDYDPTHAYSASAPPAEWSPAGVISSARSILAGGCPSPSDTVQAFYAVAAHGDEVAVAFKQAGLNWVAQFGGPAFAPPLRGLTNLAANALAFASGTAVSAAGPLYLLAVTGSTVQRFDAADGPIACGAPTTLAPSAALSLDVDPLAPAPSFHGLLGVAGGGRALAATPAADVVQVVPDTLASLGPVLRFAAYAGVSTALASVSGLPTDSVAVVEHALLAPGAGSLDTGSAELITPFDPSGTPLALGGSGYGRGAAWLASGNQAALAYAGSVPGSGGGAPSSRDDAVTAFKIDRCQAGRARVASAGGISAGAPDLIVQGPARAGAFGPAGTSLFGPASAPVYTFTAPGTTLNVHAAASTSADIGCLLGLDWSCLAGDPVIVVSTTPLDVTFSAGDATAAIRTRSSSCATCTAPFCTAPATTCPPNDLLCQSAFCPVAPAVRLARAGAASSVVALPSPPAGIAPDPAGGFLVTLPCDPTALSSTAPSCFTTSLCASFVPKGTAPAALLWLPEDGSAPRCLTVLTGLGGPIAITPNGAEAWISGPSGLLLLTRLSLPRHAQDGTLDLGAAVKLVQRSTLGRLASVAPGAAPSGIAFSSDGSSALVTVPGDYRMILFQ
jgi:hypothetical protein